MVTENTPEFDGVEGVLLLSDILGGRGFLTSMCIAVGEKHA